MTQSADDNSIVGQRIQEKFQFYVLALTFTVLGLSVQTSSFGVSRLADGLELAAWAALAVSGLVGLWRVEGTPHLYDLFAVRNQYDTRAQGLRKIESQGARSVTSLEDGLEHPISEALQNAVSSVTIIDSHLKPLKVSLQARYRAQRALFVAGFVLLVCARGWSPLRALVAVPEFTVADSGSNAVRRMRLIVEPELSRVRMLVSGSTDEIAVWGAGGTFLPPVVSSCKVFSQQDWACANANTALPGMSGTPMVVGRLEMREGVLTETLLGGGTRTYAAHWKLFGR